MDSSQWFDMDCYMLILISWNGPSVLQLLGFGAVTV